MMDGIDIIMLLSILYTVKRQTHAQLMPGSKLASRSPWNRCFKKLMPKSCPNLKTPWNPVCIRRMFPHLGKSKVTLDAKHNLNARFISNMEKVLLMLNTT